MNFPQAGFEVGGVPIPVDDEQSTNTDSLTLGQLKAMVNGQPKPRPTQYAMRYEDEDSVFDEIEEFYSYAEIHQVAENLRAWEGSFHGEWVKTSAADRKTHVNILLESLEHRNAEIRFTNARRLLYVLQGTFAETTSPEHHLHMIIENGKTVRAVNGVHNIVEALKIASAKHVLICNLSDMDTQHFNISAADKQESMEEVNTEISIYCGMLYSLVQVFKGDEEFAEELMSLDPPLPVYLMSLVSAMKEQSTRGYPLKKLLLLQWKTLLTCLGGIRELARVKKLTRELSDLPIRNEPESVLKSSPIDFKTFRQETSVKYPTFSPRRVQATPPVNVTITERVAAAIAPIPVRPHYHQQYASDISDPSMPQRLPSNSQGLPVQLPPTPAPSPPPQQNQQLAPNQQQNQPGQPPNGKAKKEKWQTDPTRPFLFPFSRRRGEPQKMVPFAIDEADRLYLRHMHVSLALYQMWQTREAYLLEESGMDPMSPEGIKALEGRSRAAFGTGPSLSSIAAAESIGVGLSAQANASRHVLDDSESADDEEGPKLPDVRKLDAAIADAAAKMKEAEAAGDRAGRRKAKERMDDLIRLRRVETLYASTLSMLHPWVIVLLRSLLATVAAQNAQAQQNQASGGIGFAPPPEPQVPSTLEDIDTLRHREIATKAVTATILLVLKWFKVSHAMKFHHLGNILLDSNCLLLILKIFGLQEVSTNVVSKNDSPDYNFFRYCHINFAKNAQHLRPEDMMLSAPPRMPMIMPPPSNPRGLGNGFNSNPEDEIEYITDFSWRNFFSTINLVKIMQKLSKGRSHRIGMLVNYKSSAILKRILKVSHPMLQLHVLKLIKSQVPFCGRKWRQTNMKVITSIYLNCRPDLRDEWLAGNEVDDNGEGLAQEQALRTLVKFYDSKRYGMHPSGAVQPTHRRTSSQSYSAEPLGGPELANMNRPLASPHIEADVFPPLRSRVTDPSVFLPFIPEDIAFEEEYEDYLSDLSESLAEGTEPPIAGYWTQDGPIRPTAEWQRIENFAADVGDGISDSESIVSIGDLGGEIRNDGSSDDVIDENLNNWEHMSPKTFKQLPRSPASGGLRRSSSGSQGLRPVIPFGLDDGSAVELDDDDEEEFGSELGPIPTGRTAPFAAGEGGKGVDEVEYLYGE